MATYYPSSANQRDIIPALYLKDSGHVPMNESVLQGNMLYLNYSQFGSYPENMAGSPNPHQSNVGLAIPGNILLQGSSLEAPDLLNSRMADPQYGSWRDGRRNEQSFMHMQDPGRSISGSNELVRHSGADNPTMNLGSELGILNGHSMSIQQTNLGGTTQGQGLSLTLGTQIPGSFHYRPDSSNMPLVGAQQPLSGNMAPGVEENSGNDKQTHIYPSSHGLSSLVNSLPNSRYLKAAQQLLDEVVNVRKALKSKLDKSQGTRSGGNGKESNEASKSDGVPAKPQESNPNSTSELSPAERQDLQNKLTKLLAMLDEVDRRYKQYYHQMQIVVSSFDVIAGNGAAKPYTALALQTISRHFRCLRDAISNQIRITRESLGEQDGSSKGGGLSRLRYIDQQLRQQRAFQQFGMMQHHAWRPQRGLPENSVSILRAWLFEHFLHPYPKDSDKIMLSRQTGLTRNQVSNWFINARVRLWKPMIEEMYKEEIGDAEIDSISSSENLPRGKDPVQSSEDQDELQSVKEGMEKPLSNHLHGCSESPNYQGTVHSEHTNYIGSDRRTQHLSSDDGGFLQQTLMQASSSSERFVSFQMSNLERYIGLGPSGVSLTLGLQHCDGGLPDGQRGMVALRGDGMLNGVPSLGADTADYSCINLPDSRQGFNSSHLLHDFVA